MHKDKYEGRHLNADKRALRRGKLGSTVVAIALLLTLTVGGTIAWLITKTEPVTNTFTPSSVSCTVTETFEGTTKSNVNVTNTGNIPAFIRVKLVTYRTNDEGQHIGGTATIPAFELGTGWVEHDGYYYYTSPVQPNEKPVNDLISSITLQSSYNDADGGKQAIDVMAEAIQSVPESAMQEAWGVTISNGTVTAYPAASEEAES